MDYGQELRFGLFPTPNAADLDQVLLLAEVAEVSGLDLVSIQDHPYQARHADAWTLLSVIAARSASLRVALNVANLPLRPPVVLAKSVATLDLVTGGRVDLGLGAGGFWDPIVAAGGTRLTPRAERRRAPRGDRGDPRRLACRRSARSTSTVSTTGSSDSTQGRLPRTRSRSGSAPTNRGC